MDLQAVKEQLEGPRFPISVDQLPPLLLERLSMHNVEVDLIDPGRLICSLKVPAHLVNPSNVLAGGTIIFLVDCLGSAAFYSIGAPTSGVSIEINVSFMDAAFLDEEIEIEAKVLRVGKTVGVVSVDLRKKKTGKIIAQGRHTKYLATSSKL